MITKEQYLEAKKIVEQYKVQQGVNGVLLIEYDFSVRALNALCKFVDVNATTIEELRDIIKEKGIGFIANQRGMGRATLNQILSAVGLEGINRYKVIS